MDTINTIILSVHGLIWGSALIILIFLIIRRVRLKKEENFEDRDN
jgi:hypothetical protein